jgi:hypothetical protein
MGLTRAEKVVDVRLRRAAMRRGFKLVRSRRRDPKAVDYGLYTLEDKLRRGLTRTGLTLEEVDRLFNDEMWPPADG